MYVHMCMCVMCMCMAARIRMIVYSRNLSLCRCSWANALIFLGIGNFWTCWCFCYFLISLLTDWMSSDRHYINKESPKTTNKLILTNNNFTKSLLIASKYEHISGPTSLESQDSNKNWIQAENSFNLELQKLFSYNFVVVVKGCFSFQSDMHAAMYVCLQYVCK